MPLPQNPLLPAAQFNPVGGVSFAGTGTNRVYTTYPYAFAPRFGLSWSPLGPRTVIRGGIGMVYSTFGTTGVQQPGFSRPPSRRT